MKRDAWTLSFKDILFALDFPELVDKPPVVPDPDRLPGAFVHIPDTNLRAAIAEALDKSPNAPITAEEMEGLGRLVVRNRDIQDLTGLQFAINLDVLDLRDNQISDLSPIVGLIQLRYLWLENTLVSDLSPVRGLENLTELGLDHTLVSDLSPVRDLKNLTRLWFRETHVSDLSPVVGLINLKHIEASDNPISDLSPLARLTKLEDIRICCGNISDLTPLINLKDLKYLHLTNNNISDISPLAGLTALTELSLDGTKNISDISPLAGLTGLNRLDLALNNISDVSPLADLTNLKWLRVSENKISDVSPLVELTNLKWLGVYNNEISDISPLDGLRENITLLWHGNLAFPTDAPKIEGQWLWVVLQYGAPSGSRDLLSEASGGDVTEVGVATHGAVEGEPVGDDVWTSRRLPPAEWNNVEQMLGGRVEDGGPIDDTFRRSNILYGTVSLYSPRQQDTTIYVGSHNAFQVWLNGTLIYQSLRYHASFDYTDFLPVTLQEGRNVLLVAVMANYNSFFGFEPGTEYTVANPGVGYALSKTPIYIDDTFTLDISAKDVIDLAGWQFDIAFDPAALEAINVSEGNFLKTNGGTTFFQSGSIDNAAGKIIGLSSARLSAQGVNGIGTLLQVRFKAKAAGETELALGKFQFGSITGDSIPAGPHKIRFTVEGGLATGDVNRDGVVSILDLILVSQQLGKRVPAGSAVDVNGDGIVSILDLIRVSQGMAGSPAAPSTPLFADPPGSPRSALRESSTSRDKQGDISFAPRLRGVGGVNPALIAAWIAQARLEDDGSLAFKQGIENLEALLRSLIPEETALLGNYPNPFNPETMDIISVSRVGSGGADDL